MLAGLDAFHHWNRYWPPSGPSRRIADRLEGRPVQVVDATVDDNRTVHEFSDAELSAILRRRVGAALAESDEERPEDAALN